ncbi:PhoU domain-containing protein [Halococcoides cellulosivorans]|uniref:AbrB family transcriptional regulator n=1 Tax=Halococcoides cellulosivorans TaxID=1679096 RepID=A0A2R4X179_9EURY|nr:PhoU domain-containing protein [Halococcoides cellulosivorans]AWB27536.1 AbrB family transcriptional regulator [Halococcoides cellulosivorans]
METRKIQQVGSGTFTVSIPADWAAAHDIEAGSTAYLYTHRDGSLVVRWNERDQSDLATTDIEASGLDPAATARTLVTAYGAGFSTIRLHAPGGLSDAQRRAVHTRARDLTGVEVTDESAEAVVVRGLLNTGDVSVRQSTIQLQYVTLSMFESALDCLTGETPSQHVVDRDDDADRLFWLLARHFNRSLQNMIELDRLGLTRSELFTYFATARQFERIADHAVTIARSVDHRDHSVSEALATETRALGMDARQVVETASKAIVDDRASGPHDSIEAAERVVRAARRLDDTLIDRAPRDASLVARVLDSVIRTAECGANIAALALRRSLAEDSGPRS